MYEIVFLAAMGFLWILFATISDLKTRSVPNWLSFSLIFFAIGFRFFFSLFSGNSFDFLYQGLLGFAIFLLIGNILYYGRMFAGGDAKIMIALGSILFFYSDLTANLQVSGLFFVLFLFTGAFYGMGWSIFLSITKFNDFKKEFNKQFKKKKRLILSSQALVLVVLLLAFFYSIIFFYFAMLVFLMPYLYLFAKAVDEACMVKKVKPSKLAEGDWLYKDVKVGKKTINAKWEGLSKKDIGLLKKHNKDVKIRQGIPFVPVFLISYTILMSILFF